MRCPKCGCVDDKVIDSRSSKDGLAIRRRRQCLECTQRFTTYEEIERGILMVIKDDGAREKFNREKLETGINVACEKRPISAEAIEEMIREVVDELYDEFDGEVPQHGGFRQFLLVRPSGQILKLAEHRAWRRQH